jgi:hypothetical protein
MFLRRSRTMTDKVARRLSVFLFGAEGYEYAVRRLETDESILADIEKLELGRLRTISTYHGTEYVPTNILAFCLRFWGGMKLEDVGKELRVTRQRVCQKLDKIRRELLRQPYRERLVGLRVVRVD